MIRARLCSILFSLEFGQLQPSSEHQVYQPPAECSLLEREWDTVILLPLDDPIVATAQREVEMVSTHCFASADFAHSPCDGGFRPVIEYNDLVGSWAGRSLSARREESPNSAEQCAG